MQFIMKNLSLYFTGKSELKNFLQHQMLALNVFKASKMAISGVEKNISQLMTPPEIIAQYIRRSHIGFFTSKGRCYNCQKLVGRPPMHGQEFLRLPKVAN